MARAGRDGRGIDSIVFEAVRFSRNDMSDDMSLEEHNDMNSVSLTY